MYTGRRFELPEIQSSCEGVHTSAGKSAPTLIQRLNKYIYEKKQNDNNQ